MNFTRAIYNTLKAQIAPAVLVYVSAENVTGPYYVMSPVSDQEQPATLCEVQNLAGEIILQFTYTGTTGAGGTEDKLGVLKTLVRAIIGDIVSSGETFEVWQNVTSGIRPLGGVALKTWDAVFESRLSWRKK